MNFEGIQIFESQQVYFADDLVRNVYPRHIPNDELVAIELHCFSSLKESTA